MKIVFRIYIVFTFILVSSIFANPVYTGIDKNEFKGSDFDLQQTHKTEVCHIELLNIDDLEQLNKLSHQKLFNNFFGAPEILGRTEVKFSSQFTLPHYGTKQRFVQQLKI